MSIYGDLNMFSIEESVDKSKIDKDFKKKSGGNFKFINIKNNKSTAVKYLSSDHDYNKTYKKHLDSIDGEIIIDLDKDTLAGYVFVIDKFIAPLFVYSKYRGYGLGDELTKNAVNKYKAKRLWVYKDNEVAIKIYKKYGFKVFYEDDEPSILMATEEKYVKDIIKSLTESTSTKYFKSDNELIKYMMSNIKYKNFTKLMSVEDVEESKSGSCHDQVIYELFHLRKMGYLAKAIFFIEYNDNSGGETHSFVYYKKNNKVCWFENAWYDQRGIHEFDSLKNIKKYIIDLHKSGKTGNNKKYPNLEFSQFGSHKPGESLQEFVDICLRNN